MNAMLNKVKSGIKWVATYLAFVSVFQFAMFMMEESIQCIQFGSWQLKNNPRMLKVGADLAEKINNNLEWVNNIGGWTNPIGWLAYREYHGAAEYWIKATKLKILAEDPEVMIGETIDVVFSPEKTENRADSTVLTAGKISMVLPQGSEIPNNLMSVEVVRANGKVVLVPKGGN